MKKVTLFFAMFMFWNQAYAIEVKTIDLYIDHSMSVTNKQFARDVTLNIHYTDDVQRLQKKFSDGLSSDPTIAKNQVMKMMQNPDFARAFQRAYRAPLMAERMGIHKIPAAVINGEGIIYGSTDIAKILTFSENKE